MNDFFVTESKLKDKDREHAEYIDHGIYYVKEEKETRFGTLKTKPKIIEFCKYAEIEFRYDSLAIENIMGYSFQVPVVTKFIVNKEINYKFDHTRIEIGNKNLFRLNQMEYNIWYCLNRYFSSGTASNPYGLFIFLDIKEKISPLGFYFRDQNIKINMDLILYLSSQKVKDRWGSLFNKSLLEFEKMSNVSKMAYYVYWTGKKDFIYEKLNDGYSDIDVLEEYIIFMKRVLFK